MKNVRNFSRDESGQIMLLFLFVVMLVLGVLMFNFSASRVIEDKLQAQNAADLAALSGGGLGRSRTESHFHE